MSFFLGYKVMGKRAKTGMVFHPWGCRAHGGVNIMRVLDGYLTYRPLPHVSGITSGFGHGPGKRCWTQIRALTAQRCARSLYCITHTLVTAGQNDRRYLRVERIPDQK